jgi:hypothetical protein
MKRKEPTRIQILQEIFECFQQVTQWMPGTTTDADYSNGVTKYLFKAEALIEILEVTDCGSTGGFDKGQESQGLVERFLWLLDKYNKRTDIKESCGFTPDSIHKYFCKTDELRDEILNEKV